MQIPLTVVEQCSHVSHNIVHNELVNNRRKKVQNGQKKDIDSWYKADEARGMRSQYTKPSHYIEGSGETIQKTWGNKKKLRWLLNPS